MQVNGAVVRERLLGRVEDQHHRGAEAPEAVLRDDDADFARNPFLKKGYIGPKALLDNGVRYLVDPRVAEGTAWVTGANEDGKHVIDLVVGRDFTADGTIEGLRITYPGEGYGQAPRVTIRPNGFGRIVDHDLAREKT